MSKKIINILGLTLSCQSGRRVATTILAAVPLVASAGPVSWAHQNGSLQSNGAITVKSLSGGSYAGTSNPAGAVAKANQSAVTQPPTVIIQATSSSNVQMTPLVSSSATIPTCPTGYHSVWSASSISYPSCNIPTAYNIAGSRFSFGGYGSPGYSVGFSIDSVPFGVSNGSGTPSNTNTLMNTPWSPNGSSVACYSGGFVPWSANLCSM